MRTGLVRQVGDVSGAGGQVEDAQTGTRRSKAQQAPLPRTILPVRQHHGDEIVAVGNGGKQRPDIAALSVRRRNRLAQGHPVDNSAPMLPTSTVENYIKAIYLGQTALTADARLVPMGQVAAALGVTPGRRRPW